MTSPHSISPQNRLHEHQFTDVVFTHPHLGTESPSMHAALLAHFFHSARQLLSITTTTGAV